MKRITIIAAALAAAALATTYIQTSSTGVAPWKPVKDSVSRAHLADSALKADSSRAAWKADSARIAWFAHAATYADSSRITHRADSSAYADSSRASRISDSAKKIPGSTPYRYLMTQANGSVSAGALYDSAGKLFSPESLVVGTQSSAATIGVNSRNSVITGYYMMDANKKRWGLTRGALSDSFLLRAYTPSEAIIDTPLAFGVSAGDSGRITRPFKFSSGLRVLGGIAGTADSARTAGTAANSLALGGIAADQYGTLAKDTTISRKVVSDSLTANTRGWTTLAAAKSSIHDSLAVERTFDTAVSRNVAHDTATAIRTYVGSASTTGNAATATKLATARTIGMSGDVTGAATAFDGTANITIPTTLPTLLTAGSAGSATSVPTLTWDAKGRLTAVGSAAISIPHTQINDWTSAVSNVYLPLSGGTMGGYISFANVTTGYGPGLIGAIADNDFWRITGYASATDVGSLEIAAADGGNEPIYVRQYTYNGTSSFGTLTRSATLLDGSGNTSFPGTITASGFVGNLTGTASNASALGGVNSDNFVQGNGDATWGTRTTNLPGSSTALSQGLKSGFYDNDGTNGSGSPTGGWCHMIVNANTGSSASNQYQWELASGFWNGEIYSRTISKGVVGSWRTLIHSDNYPSFNNFTSGLSTTTLTASGLITANGGITGNLTGHASLDIPLTGSSAITGALTSSNLSNLGSATLQWGSIYGSTIYENGTSLSSKYQPLENQRLSTGNSPYFTSLGVASTNNSTIQHLIGLNADGSISQRSVSGEAFIVATPSAMAFKTLTYTMSDGSNVNITLGGRLTAGELYATGSLTVNGGLQAKGSINLPSQEYATSSTLPVVAAGEVKVIYSTGHGTTNYFIANSSQGVTYRNSSGTKTYIAAGGTLFLDLYGSAAILVGISSSQAELIL